MSIRSLLTADISFAGGFGRCTKPQLSSEGKQHWTSALMTERRARGQAKRASDEASRERARQAVDICKVVLGERVPVWWTDGAPNQNRPMVKNTSYAGWFEALDDKSDLVKDRGLKSRATT